MQARNGHHACRNCDFIIVIDPVVAVTKCAWFEREWERHEPGGGFSRAPELLCEPIMGQPPQAVYQLADDVCVSRRNNGLAHAHVQNRSQKR